MPHNPKGTGPPTHTHGEGCHGRVCSPQPLFPHSSTPLCACSRGQRSFSAACRVLVWALGLQWGEPAVCGTERVPEHSRAVRLGLGQGTFRVALVGSLPRGPSQVCGGGGSVFSAWIPPAQAEISLWSPGSRVEGRWGMSMMAPWRNPVWAHSCCHLTARSLLSLWEGCAVPVSPLQPSPLEHHEGCSRSAARPTGYLFCHLNHISTLPLIWLIQNINARRGGGRAATKCHQPLILCRLMGDHNCPDGEEA